MAVGTITYRGSAVDLLIARSDRGAPNSARLVQEESLTTPGVDGTRWRVMFRQYEPTQLYTVVDCGTYAIGILYKQIIEKLKGKLVTVKLDISGVSYSFQNVHVEAVGATVFPGPAVGNGATGTAHIVAVWSLVPTDFAAV